jgi:hypothetical protein
MQWETLDKLIDELESMIDLKAGRGLRVMLDILVPSTVTWSVVWAKTGEVQRGFKGVRYPTLSQREQAWQRFNSMRDDASRLSKGERESHQWRSASFKDEILNTVESSRPNDLFGLDPVNVEDMKALGRVLREAGEILSQRKKEMLAEHKEECFHAIQKMRAVHDAWWAQLKHWKAQRHGDFQTRVRMNLEKNHERHRKATDALQRHRARADELRSQIASAWNQDWADRAEGWLSELDEKIADIERSIEQIEGWIAEDESKLEY